MLASCARALPAPPTLSNEKSANARRFHFSLPPRSYGLPPSQPSSWAKLGAANADLARHGQAPPDAQHSAVAGNPAGGALKATIVRHSTVSWRTVFAPDCHHPFTRLSR